MFYTETHSVETAKNGWVDLTPEMNAVLERSGIKNGLLVVEIPHSTAGDMATTDNVPCVRDDLMDEVKRVVPSRINPRMMPQATSSADCSATPSLPSSPTARWSPAASSVTS